MDVTVEFWGVSAIGGGRQRLKLPVGDSMTVRELLCLAGEQWGEAVLPEQLEGLFMVLVEGNNILHLEGWDTVVQPDQRVSVVPLLGGG